jgi:hypothetical protein
VNNDGRVNGSDLLLLINKILVDGQGQLPAVASVPPYLDPTGDGRLNTSDLLSVINYILNPPASAPLVATADEASPQATPLATLPDSSETNAISSGLAAMQQKATEVDQPVVAPAVAASDANGNLSSRSVDRVMYEATPDIAGVDDAEPWDFELDGIFGDLDDELESRASV